MSKYKAAGYLPFALSSFPFCLEMVHRQIDVMET